MPNLKALLSVLRPFPFLGRRTVLEHIGFGFMTWTRTRGRRPDHMGEVYPELQAMYQKMVIERAEHSA